MFFSSSLVLLLPPRVVLISVVLCLSGCADQTSPTPLPGQASSSSSSGGGTSSGNPPPAAATNDPTTTHIAGTLRLEQFNVRRYFDTTCDSNNCTAADAFEDVATPDEFAARTTQIAQGLMKVDADVITLAEVENQGCLDALQKALKDGGQDYPVAYLAETGSPGSVDVGVLARGKLDKVVNHRDDTPLTTAAGTKTTFTRELPELHLTIGSTPVIVFAAHFRSKAGTDDPARRLAEAKATHDIMIATGAANAGVLVLLGGDLNDSPASPPLDALESDGALLRVAKDIPADAQGTYTFSGKKEAIDHIFTTAANTAHYVAMSATVIRDGAASGTGGFAGSDHASLFADFTFP